VTTLVFRLVCENSCVDDDRVRLAVSAVEAVATALDLPTRDVDIIQNSNKLALRLLPCDAFARVAPIGNTAQLAFEIEIAQQFAAAGAPAGTLDPRVEAKVHQHGAFAITWWTYHAAESRGQPSPARYAATLEHLHRALRDVAVAAPHFLDRVDEAEQLLSCADRTPELDNAERDCLLDTLADARRTIEHSGATEQLLHGEPHPGNILNASTGPLFIDLETCCRGPVEFDVAHVPRDVSEHYSGLDQHLLDECRRLVLAMVAAWRWDVNDEFPDGLHHGRAIVDILRDGPPWPTIGEIGQR
jgi:hypothetical protein